ncbi:MAG: OmpH family outer membrane protein [bacterium]|nr:OmpH family outer membrane protein [bacterium]
MKYRFASFVVIFFLLGIVNILGVVNINATSLTKIAYVDIAQVFDQFKETKRVTGILNDEIKSKKTEIEKKQKEIEKLERELKEAIMLSEQEKAKREAVIKQKKLAIQKFADTIKSGLLKEEQDQTQRIIKIIYEVIEDIAVKEGVSIVVDKSMVLYGIEEINLTQKVIDILNKKQ